MISLNSIFAISYHSIFAIEIDTETTQSLSPGSSAVLTDIEDTQSLSPEYGHMFLFLLSRLRSTVFL